MRYKQVSEGIRRAIDRAREAVESTIHFELTFPEYLKRACAHHSEPWFKKLPGYAHAEVRGYEECYYNAKLETVPGSAVISAHLVDGVLYLNYNEWREANPEGDPRTALSNTYCSVYRSGKVFCMYAAGSVCTPPGNGDCEHSEHEGHTFPFANGIRQVIDRDLEGKKVTNITA